MDLPDREEPTMNMSSWAGRERETSASMGMGGRRWRWRWIRLCSSFGVLLGRSVKSRDESVYLDEVATGTGNGVGMRVDEGKQGYDGELSLGENDELRNTHLVAIRQAQKMAMTSNFPSLEWNESEEESMTSVKTFTDEVRKSSVSLENDIGQVYMYSAFGAHLGVQLNNVRFASPDS
jgi:hypothetical protein